MHFSKWHVSMFFLIVCGMVMLTACQETQDNNARKKAVLSTTFTMTASSHMNSDQHLSVDGLLSGSTIWHAQTPPHYPEWVQVKYSRPKKVKSFSMKPQDSSPNGQEYLRAPKDFQLAGGNDGKTWQTLLTVKNNIPGDSKQWGAWKIDTPGEYLYYRITITAGGNPALLTIQQIKLD